MCVVSAAVICIMWCACNSRVGKTHAPSRRAAVTAQAIAIYVGASAELFLYVCETERNDAELRAVTCVLLNPTVSTVNNSVSKLKRIGFWRGKLECFTLLEFLQRCARASTVAGCENSRDISCMYESVRMHAYEIISISVRESTVKERELFKLFSPGEH